VIRLILLFLIPFFFALYYVVRGQREKAFLNVYLPCTFLVPYYYSFRIPHLPVLSVGTAVLLPIGLSILFKPVNRWQFRRMDFLVVLFMISYGLSEVLREASPKDGMILWLQKFIEIFLAYIVGRQIIEPRLRLEMIKRIIFMFVILAPFAAYEWRFGQNMWLNASARIFNLPNVGWFVQLRGGHARLALAFADAILAGMFFVMGIALNFYLLQIYKVNKTRLGPWMSKIQRYHVAFLLLPLYLFLTNSRMPMACGVLCFIIIQIPRYKDMRTAAIVVALIAVVGGGSAYAYFKSYTSVREDKASGEEQTSAIYRQQLSDLYAPILQAGGILGYGSLSHPGVIGLGSIDNNYINVQLAQGYFGKYTFILLGVESFITLAYFGMKFRSRESLFLVFSLMGTLIAIFVSLTTVYLGEQVTQILFLLLGWSQSLQDTGPLAYRGQAAADSLPEPKFRFKRVIA
jgi:hypothetical protein